jgi:ComF family protein
MRSFFQTPHRRIGSLCAVCDQWGRSVACDDCIHRYAAPANRCRRCAIRLPEGVSPEGVSCCERCLARAPAFDQAFAALDYRFPWQGLISKFKFRHRPEWADFFAQWMIHSLRDSGEFSATLTPSCVTAVPMSRKGLRTRGYNQAWELAKRCADQLGLNAQPDLISKVRQTEHQAGLTLERRHQNLADAFVVSPRAVHAVAGHHIVVVDDVMTTGATAHAVAKALKHAGAVQVSIWVLARTPADGGAGL